MAVDSAGPREAVFAVVSGAVVESILTCGCTEGVAARVSRSTANKVGSCMDRAGSGEGVVDHYSPAQAPFLDG